jgi:hypothetical protein
VRSVAFTVNGNQFGTSKYTQTSVALAISHTLVKGRAFGDCGCRFESGVSETSESASPTYRHPTRFVL